MRTASISVRASSSDAALASVAINRDFLTTISWLPEILIADGTSEGYAGTLSGITQLVQIAPAFAMPVLAARRTSQFDLLAVIVGTALIGLLGVLLAPDAAPIWMVFLGIGQGATILLRATLFVDLYGTERIGVINGLAST